MECKAPHHGTARRRPEKDRESARHGVSHEGQSDLHGTEDAGTLERDRAVREDSPGPCRCAVVRVARRAALCQRQHPPGTRLQQAAEGLHRQVEDDAGLRLAVRAGLGLPRVADRDQGGRPTGLEEGPHDGGRDPRRVPQVCPEVREPAERVVPAAGGVRALGGSVPDDEPGLRGCDCRGVCRFPCAGLRVQGPEAGELVPELPHGAGGSRGGVRGPLEPVDLGAIPAARRCGGDQPRPGGEERLRVDLDDDTLDDSGERGHCLPPGV